METALFNLLEPLNIPVIPVAPGATENFDPTVPVLPAIVYRRKNTNVVRDLSGNMRYKEILVEIISNGQNFQQTSNIADSIISTLNNVSSGGYSFYLTDQYTDPRLFTIHLLFWVWHSE